MTDKDIFSEVTSSDIRSEQIIEEIRDMRNEFTAIVKRDGKLFIAIARKFPVRTVRAGLKRNVSKVCQAIKLILQDRQEV